MPKQFAEPEKWPTTFSFERQFIIFSFDIRKTKTSYIADIFKCSFLFLILKSMRPSPKRAEALNIASSVEWCNHKIISRELPVPDHAMAFFSFARVESPFTFDMIIRGNYCDLKGTNLWLPVFLKFLQTDAQLTSSMFARANKSAFSQVFFWSSTSKKIKFTKRVTSKKYLD